MAQCPKQECIIQRWWAKPIIKCFQYFFVQLTPEVFLTSVMDVRNVSLVQLVVCQDVWILWKNWRAFLPLRGRGHRWPTPCRMPLWACLLNGPVSQPLIQKSLGPLNLTRWLLNPHGRWTVSFVSSEMGFLQRPGALSSSSVLRLFLSLHNNKHDVCVATFRLRLAFIVVARLWVPRPRDLICYSPNRPNNYEQPHTLGWFKIFCLYPFSEKSPSANTSVPCSFFHEGKVQGGG